MKLTKKQAEDLIQFLNNERNNRLPCPICGNVNWVISDSLWEVREFNGGNLVIGGQSAIMPMVAISCSKCGETHFLNAIQLGIVSKDQPIEEATKQK